MVVAEERIKLPNPHVAQVKVLTERKRFNVVACGRRWGKTKLGGSLAIQTAYEGLPVGWFAPSYKALKDALTEIHSRVKDARAHVKYVGEAKRFEFSNGGVIEFWSTEPQFAGDEESEVARGRKYALAIYDEAAHARRLKADWTRAIRATLADYEGDAWFFSTPRGRNYFHDLYMRGQQGAEGWASWRMPTSENPHISASEIEAAERDLPRDAYEQEYLAEFMANSANPFGIDAIHRCIAPLAEGPVAYWGVDLAKSNDWLVAIGLNAMGKVCAFQRWQADSKAETAYWKRSKLRLSAMIKTAPALIDATVAQDAIVEDIKQTAPNVEGFVFTSKSKQSLMETLAYAIQNRSVSFPRDILGKPIPLVDELESFQYEYKPSGVQYKAPAGLHDDCVCALALAVMCRATAPKPAQLTLLHTGEEPRDTYATGYDPFADDERWEAV